MRAARLLFLLVLALGTGLFGCGTGTCTSANGATPAASAGARFYAVAWSGTASQVVLLAPTPSLDASGARRMDASGHALSTVARVRDYTIDGSARTAESFLDNHSAWPNMQGRGLGTTPRAPAAPAGGPFVALGAANSVVRFTLDPEDGTNDAGVVTGDAGVSPMQRSHTWEWVWPLPTTELPADATAPGLLDLVVAPRFLPDHDVAFVARTASLVNGSLVGGELFALDVDDPAHVARLATISFDAYADAGFRAVPGALAYADGLLFVALDHQTFTPPTPLLGTGLVAVIDPAGRTVRTVLRLPGMTNCVRIAPYNPPARAVPDRSETHRLIVSCLGGAPTDTGIAPLDAGFAFLEYDGAVAITQTISAASLGLGRPDASVMPLYGDWIAIITHGSTSPPIRPDRLVAANLVTGATQILATAPSANGSSLFGLGEGAFDPSSGVLVVGNGFEGVLTWSMSSDPAVLESASAPYTFADSVAVGVTGCGHVPTRVVRALGAGGALITPMPDAGMPEDAAVGDDAAVDVDAFVDVDADVDAGP